ncbi:hypothetical protein [Delftia acidovorans]|uniref:hypothetical protein n=1 Tax=Delftia acidovorans TaxID=80866 RepID=UPI0028AAA9BE|nr:hypothetical protein [Delftia acidovorans]
MIAPNHLKHTAATDPACRSQKDLNEGMQPIEQFADLVQRIALTPASQHHRLLCFRAIDQWLCRFVASNLYSRGSHYMASTS